MMELVGDENEWRSTTTDVRTVDLDGNPIVLPNVPAERNSRTGKLRVDPDVVARADVERIGRAHGIEGRRIPLMLMLFAKPGPFKEGLVQNKYKLNKMLFYQWKRLESEGLGEAYPRDDFAAARAGPIPVGLRDDLQSLQRQGMVEVKWSKRRDAPTEIRLTPQGFDVARGVWSEMPLVYRDTTLAVKKELFPLSPATIKDLVHEQYPEYRKTYVEVDAE